MFHTPDYMDVQVELNYYNFFFIYIFSDITVFSQRVHFSIKRFVFLKTKDALTVYCILFMLMLSILH